MPFALVFVGLLLIVTGAKNTYREFGGELQSDFTGEGNFVYWVIAIGVIGSLGYVKALEGFSRLFLVLIVVAMVIRNGGVFDKLTSALAAGPTKPQSASSGNGMNTANYVPIPPTPAANNNSNAQGNFMTFVQGLKVLIGLAA